MPKPATVTHLILGPLGRTVFQRLQGLCLGPDPSLPALTVAPAPQPWLPPSRPSGGLPLAWSTKPGLLCPPTLCWGRAATLLQNTPGLTPLPR